mmetsp:Transcript_12996/g.37069  ORF Transcript_12996/g.37069 Transcript_12996/m.37069 type:complete len:335 (+) Transcript_12996:127-1131(+)
MALLETTSKGEGSQSELLQSGQMNPSSSQHSNAAAAAAAASTSISTSTPVHDISKDGIAKEITRGVIRAKLAKMRHLVIRQGIQPAYLDALMPAIIDNFRPQTVMYNGGVAKIKEWKLSCYLEVMEGSVPCANPDLNMLSICLPLLECCDDVFASWYRQQHSCNDAGQRKASSTRGGSGGEENIDNCDRVASAHGKAVVEKNGCGGKEKDQDRSGDAIKVKRLMTFITRYTSAPNENALLKHVDGAGKVDGSVVVALPVDRWTGPEEVNSFEGHGGGLTFWDGKSRPLGRPQEIQYDTRSGDLAFIDRAVWHQANPITKGTRWALVIFYKVADS